MNSIIRESPIGFFFFFFSLLGLWAWLGGYYLYQKRDALDVALVGIGLLQILLLALFM